MIRPISSLPPVGGASWCSLFLLFSFFLSALAFPKDDKRVEGESQHILALLDSSQEATTSSLLEANRTKPLDTLPAILDALDVMQQEYFEAWQGTWPTAIDWTSAVMGTHASATLSSLSKALDYKVSHKSALPPKARLHENTINLYFSHLVASYFGQNAFGLRGQAFDDMLWVVLGWLEGIKFVTLHHELHYSEEKFKDEEQLNWYGLEWIPSFAHRARIFWELASRGWDTTLCNGGMIWSPYLKPYKNAITNELFITASISMYLYFPGDENASPFGVFESPSELSQANDPKYLAAAVDAYKWLVDSNMTDNNGLYVDGYHVTGWRRGKSDGTKKCDLRDEMVFTYNQGVLLSGQRGLWEATGARSYLEDGHDLVESVINATGYDLKTNTVRDATVIDKDSSNPHMRLGHWYGLGRSGILEDACDAAAQCSQDSQTFKGIFFHHLTLFCAPLPTSIHLPEEPAVTQVPSDLKSWHDGKCASYGKWITRNAEAAQGTASRDGRYGAWWGAPKDISVTEVEDIPPQELPPGAVDYRSFGIPKDEIWTDEWMSIESRFDYGKPKIKTGITNIDPLDLLNVREDGMRMGSARGRRTEIGERDWNDRGRGRTVETQGGGISVLRANWELVDRRKSA